MEIKVIEEKNNPMLKRREVKFVVSHDGPTPSRKSVIEKIAATMNSKVGLVMVDSLKSEFGKRETVGYAKIYDTEERAKEVERAHVIARNVPAPAAQAEESG
ncbi:MAG: 30S ribosomal protein S24e [Methanothrix sp.]|jgi:small subunit ribosomal protein S24e|nr:30S ribosomal protein S24e [Methanothrix sp.]OPX80495.1 MAG: 30S ribosomal protein S24e [Methanosaeta sp. PtaB.Bin087]OPY52425.1 MAG: 30S ribosomal protein S24e [Methanosaeta sp. PtaU1.Bin055]NLX37996.1 30S ribosomal protein S24e [Methanothrix sp.]HNR57532.1 30S ribosomal protein S24e [Methanothrix sp.]